MTMTSLRSKIVRLAYTRPELRRDLLPLLKTSSGKPVVRRFSQNDWREYPGAKKFNDGTNPYLVVVDLPGRHIFSPEYSAAVGIADGEGVRFHFYTDTGKEGPHLYRKERSLASYQGLAILENAASFLKSGQKPRGFGTRAAGLSR